MSAGKHIVSYDVHTLAAEVSKYGGTFEYIIADTKRADLEESNDDNVVEAPKGT